jgi:hypothetical protein
MFSCKLLTSFFFIFFTFIFSQAFSMELSFPLKCNLGTNCFFQNFFDHDLGEGIQDYKCGTMTTPNQKGTSIRVADTNQMIKGIEVIASAPGTVISIQNNIPDQVLTEQVKKNLLGQECGNNIILSHGKGLQTRYCHMMRNSVIVAPGDKIERKQSLGLLGLSGFTKYPHLEFLVIKDDQLIDPFYPAENITNCSQSQNSLWIDSNAMNYHDSQVISSGFSSTLPQLNQVVLGDHHPAFLPWSTKRLVFWIQIIGAKKEDIHSIIIYNQRDQIIAESSNNVLDANQSVGIFSIVHELTSGNLAPGLYKGLFIAERMIDGKKSIVEQHNNQIVLQ